MSAYDRFLLRIVRLFALMLFIVTFAPVGSVNATHTIDPDWSAPRTVYIPETGQTLDRLFLDLWRNGGDVRSYGYPITPEIELGNGHIVQYLQYARFEYWPDGNSEGELAFLAEIGRELEPAAEPAAVRRTSRNSDEDEQIQDQAVIEAAWEPLQSDVADRSESVDWRYVAETRHSVQYGFKQFWEETGEERFLGNPISEEYLLDSVTYQTFERGQLAWSPAEGIWMVPVGEVLVERYELDTAPQPQASLPVYDELLFVPNLLEHPTLNVPRPPDGYERAIVVSLSGQMLWAWEGDQIVLKTYVSTGRDQFATPPGLFYINWKVPVQDMVGVIGGESYNVPQVPDVMYFTNRGHAIHGTYWHNNFGVPMSHGCINVPMGTSLWLYEWAPVNTPVLIVN